MCLGFLFAFVAQWIEHPPPKGRVARSIRAEGTIFYAVVIITLPRVLPNSR